MFLKSLFWQIINSLIKIFLEIFVFDRKIRRILKGNWAKFYLRKYVGDKYNYYAPSPLTPLPQGEGNRPEPSPLTSSPQGEGNRHTPTPQPTPSRGGGDCYSQMFVPQPPPETHNADQALPDNNITIWQYWESKDGTIPPLVQACLNSVEKYKGDKCKRILLTPENVKEYVEIPQLFWDLKEKGKIKTAFFSDILRACLLIQNGGIWIDATVLLTEELPSYIIDADLFVFQNDLKIDLDGLNMASYFISAKKDNKILKETLSALIQYWKENNFLVNYFTFLHTFTMVTQANKENKELFAKVPFFNFLPVQQFQGELLNQFSEERWEEVKKISGIHKLTHKQSVLTKEKNIDITGTFYEHIIKEFC